MVGERLCFFVTRLARPHSGVCTQGWNYIGAQFVPVYRGRRTDQGSDRTDCWAAGEQPPSLPRMLFLLGESLRVIAKKGILFPCCFQALSWVDLVCFVCGEGVCRLSNRVLGFIIDSVCCPQAPKTAPIPPSACLPFESSQELSF